MAGNACTVVSGLVDILVEGGDRDEAGAALGALGHLWAYNVRWRACPDTDLDCPWQETRPFDTIPDVWADSGNADTPVQFSARVPWVSTGSYCDAGWDYAIVTNYDNDQPDVAGAWDTRPIADGSYSVSVELTDFAGNPTVMTRRACVQNAAACTAELVIRDATDDYGAIPYPGPNWWLSPDITANPGTPDEDRNIRLGVANPIEVRIWNYGSCDLPAGTTYDVCLGWGLPSGSLPAGQQIGCQTKTVEAGGWVVGTSRTTRITWTPDPALIPEGHHCLIAWLDFQPDDPLQNTPAVNWDDNRAQQNITFAPAPTAGSPFFSMFWVHPMDLIKARSIELTLRYSHNRPTLRKIRLHVPPGLIVDEIVGGSVIGDFLGDKPIEPCELSPEELGRTICQSWEESNKIGYTRIIGGIDPSGRLLLQNLRVLRGPVGLTLEVWPEQGVRKGEFADIEVVEHGLLEGHRQITPVGGLTVRFEH